MNSFSTAKVCSIVAFAALLVFLPGCLMTRDAAGRGSLPLADGGVPLVDIAVAPDAGEDVLFAANELKEHLDRIVGGSFAVVSRPAVGRKRIRIACAPSLAKQEVRISFSGDGVELESGGHPEYAVWDFLWNCCGVRWLDPTDAGTVIPVDPSLSVRRRDFADRPFAKGREPTGGYSPELWEKGTPGWTNYLQVAYPSAFRNRSFADAEREISRRKALFLRRMKSGGEPVRACHSFGWWYDRFWYRDRPKFERFEPDYFAKGYGDVRKTPPQLCYSSPDVIKQTVADARAYFDTGHYRPGDDGEPAYQWGRDVCCIEPLDNISFCLCERCARQYRPELEELKSQHSDYWFGFVNAVAREIAKSHPGKKISTLAYATHTGVPSFRLEPNVVVHFCFMCNRMPYTRRNDVEAMQLREWREACPGRPLGLWLYNTFPKEHTVRFREGNCFPGFFARALRAEYALFHELDISENIYNCGFVDDYENFLSLRWMWNPKEPLETLESEYFSSYGGAAGPLRRFYRIVEERYCSPRSYPREFLENYYFQTTDIAWNSLGTDDVMRELGDLMEEAERRADTPMAKARVANWRAGIYEYMRAGAAEAKGAASKGGRTF